MEKYELKTVPLTSLIVTPMGPVNPICTQCCNNNCGHPIEKKSVSIFGKIEEHKVLIGFANDIRLVIECQGFIQNEKEENNKKSIPQDGEEDQGRSEE